MSILTKETLDAFEDNPLLVQILKWQEEDVTCMNKIKETVDDDQTGSVYNLNVDLPLGIVRKTLDFFIVQRLGSKWSGKRQFLNLASSMTKFAASKDFKSVSFPESVMEAPEMQDIEPLSKERETALFDQKSLCMQFGLIAASLKRALQNDQYHFLNIRAGAHLVMLPVNILRLRNICRFANCHNLATQMCTRCYAVVYCSIEHQRNDWKVHQKECFEVKKEDRKQAKQDWKTVMKFINRYRVATIQKIIRRAQTGQTDALYQSHESDHAESSDLFIQALMRFQGKHYNYYRSENEILKVCETEESMV